MENEKGRAHFEAKSRNEIFSVAKMSRSETLKKSRINYSNEPERHLHPAETSSANKRSTGSRWGSFEK